jgi:hypothetical protein
MTWRVWDTSSYTFWKVFETSDYIIEWSHAISLSTPSCHKHHLISLYQSNNCWFTLYSEGSLPWQGLKAKNAQKKYRMILEKKQQVSIAQLCQGCPSQFAEFLVWQLQLMLCQSLYFYILISFWWVAHWRIVYQAYTRSLKFDARPDIPYIRKLFRELYHAQNCDSIPKTWDWEHLDTDMLKTGSTCSRRWIAIEW